MSDHPHLSDAKIILAALGLPKPQQNDRSAVTLLALLNLTPEKRWDAAENPLIGITPVMEFAAKHYEMHYAPNTRETVRRHTMHQFRDAGLVVYNPDAPERPVNSPKTVYQIEAQALKLLRAYGTSEWETHLQNYLTLHGTLAARYASERQMQRLPVQFKNEQITLSPGKHSELIRAVIEEFAPRFIPGCTLIYIGDTGNKWGYFDDVLLQKLGVTVDMHGKMPDVVLYDIVKNRIMLIEAVTSHGPVDGKRKGELANLFKQAQVDIVYMTALPDRTMLKRYLSEIAWETHVWLADQPDHLIHFNGSQFL